MTQTLLAIDDRSLPLRKHTCLHLSRPKVRPEPVLTPSPSDSDAPDNQAAHFYGTVLQDSGKFRMWYYACHRGVNPDWPAKKMRQIARKARPGWEIGTTDAPRMYQGPICYAESDDGISWTKPSIDQLMFKGNRSNNALDLPHAVVSGATVIKDSEDPDPDRRYKMVYQFFPDQTEPAIPEYGTKPSIACAVSPDGLNWTINTLPFVNQFVEHCSFIKHRGRYIVHSQAFPDFSGQRIEGDSGGGRRGIAHETRDFDHWPDLWQWSFGLPEPVDPNLRGSDQAYDQVHLGIGAASLGNICVGVYGLWHSASFGADFARVSCDLGLVVSNDGVHFREPGVTPGRPFVHRDSSPVTAVPGRDLNTILCQGNGILNVGDETRIYHGRWRNAGHRAEDIAAWYYAEVALATLRRDRWGSLALNQDASEGTACSRPIPFPHGNCELEINADGVSHISVDLLDEQMHPIPGFRGGRVVGEDGLDRRVRWPDRSPARLAGQGVRIHLNLKRKTDALPRVYAVYLKDTEEG